MGFGRLHGSHALENVAKKRRDKIKMEVKSLLVAMVDGVEEILGFGVVWLSEGEGALFKGRL